MLAAAIPGTSFVDPLGSVDPTGAGADVPVVTQDADPPSTNGSEAAS
jgi:hypothetical protein